MPFSIEQSNSKEYEEESQGPPTPEVLHQVAVSHFLTSKELGKFLFLSTNKKLQAELGGKSYIWELLCRSIVNESTSKVKSRNQSKPAPVDKTTKISSVFQAPPNTTSSNRQQPPSTTTAVLTGH